MIRYIETMGILMIAYQLGAEEWWFVAMCVLSLTGVWCDFKARNRR